jgi:membrane-associated phospholipid phosphatase
LSSTQESTTQPGRGARIARRLWRAQFIYLTALALFAVLAVFAHTYRYFAWDLELERAIQRLSIPGFAALMRATSIFGNGVLPWAASVAVLILFLVKGHRSEAKGMLMSTAGGELLNLVVKLVIDRPRPSPEQVRVFQPLGSESFPSGHVMFYVVFFGFLFFVSYALLPRGSFQRRLALFLCAMPVALVGLSRVYLGEHWPSDVMGAYLLGGLWLALSVEVYRRLRNTKREIHKDIQD